MTTAVRHYAAYGLRIHSEIPLPLASAGAEGPPDVRIRRGVVGETLGAAGTGRRHWEAVPGLYLLRAEGVARYLVREGREIVVDRIGDEDPALVSLLLGSVLAACLKQRGVCTLHASAAATADGAVLFAGHSGAGKSTLVAALLERGYAMLADDVTGIVMNGDGAPEALPAFPVLRLGGNAVETLGWRGRVRGAVPEGLDKHVVPIESTAAGPLPVRMVFVLAQHDQDGIEMETLSLADALDRLTKRVYRPRYARLLGRAREQFRTLAALVGRVPAVRVATSHRTVAPAALAERVETCLRDGAPRRSRRPAAGGTARGERVSLGRRTAGAAGRPAEAGAAQGLRVQVRPARQELPSGGVVESCAGEAPGGSIVWLASYLYSCNRSLRVLLTNYLSGNQHAATIRAPAGRSFVAARVVFDEAPGPPSSDLTPEEVRRDRLGLNELLAAELPRPTFVDVHDACLRTPDGDLLFPPPASLGAVYVVRNPLELTASLARRRSWPVGRAVAELNRPAASLSSRSAGIHTMLPQRLPTWSGHAASWLDQKTLPVHVVRCEDLVADPGGAVGAVLRFAGVEPDAGRLSRAVEHVRPRPREERSASAEKPRAGYSYRPVRAQSWRDVLSAAQVRLLTEAHAPLMERFGYLREAEAFLKSQ